MMYVFRHLRVTRALFLTSCLLLSAVVHADLGEIFLNVVDARTQRPIDSAEISLVSRDGVTRKAEIKSEGNAVIGSLEPGLYEVTISAPNYRSAKLPSVRVVKKKATAFRVELTLARADIEETLVTASPISVDNLSSVGTSYIDREALRSAAGSGSDVLRALDGLPGLFSSGDFASFTVRGNGPRDNLILVDGIPFDNVVHFEDSFGEQEEIEGGGRFSVFAPNLISGAEFQPGGFGAAYGGKAGSLLKLEVAEGNPLTPSYTTRIDLAGIEVGYDGPSGIDDDTSVLFSARRLNFGRVFETIGEEDIGTPILTDVIFKSTTEFTSGDTLNFLAIYAPEEFTRDVDNVLASDEDDPGNYEDVELIEVERDNSLFAVSWSTFFGNTGEFVSRLYYRNFDESSSNGEALPDLVDIDAPASAVPLREDILLGSREEREIGFISDYSVVNTVGTFTAGLQAKRVDLGFELALDDDWIRYVYDQNDFRPDPEQRFIVLTPEFVDNTFDETTTSYSFYVDQTYDLNRWEFRSGLRFDRDGMTDETLFSPRLSANWQASEKLRFSSTAGIYYQSPRFNDRASDENNTALENEKISQLSVGLTYALKSDLDLLVETYYQNLDNLVVELDGVDQTLLNTGEGTSYGFDMALIKRFDNGWSANMNYSYNRARVRDRNDLPYYDADFSRPHFFGIGGAWEINERWKISGRWKWASGTPRDEFIVYDNVLGDGELLRFSKEIVSTNTDRYKSFNSLNFRADYRRSFGATNIIAFIDVINVFGADNPSSSDFNERTGVDVVEDGSAVPLIGLRLEW